MEQCGPDQPGQRDGHADADERNQQRSGQPGPRVAATQALGGIGHLPIVRAMWRALTARSPGTMADMAHPALRVDSRGERLRLLHVHAHPDDESSKGAATTAKYVAEGVDVLVATCTGGERGSILNPAMDRPDVLANIGEIRRQEMAQANAFDRCVWPVCPEVRE